MQRQLPQFPANPMMTATASSPGSEIGANMRSPAHPAMGVDRIGGAPEINHSDPEINHSETAPGAKRSCFETRR
jgi:hypothetical protein